MFSREKAPVVSLPSPPNIRQILEDIESCQKTDPVFDLALYLSKKSKQSLIEASSSLQDTVPKPSDSPKLTGETEDSPSNSKSSGQSKKSSKKKNTKGVTKGTKPTSSEHNDATYSNIIQFTTVCDQTTDLISDIEPMLKTLDIDMAEFLKSLDAKLRDAEEQQNIKNDSDTDNKLL